jgi:hypothetical protein
MAKFRYGWVLVLILAALMLAACGGDDDDKLQGGSSIGTLVPTSRFPPTWTPAPTNTEAPRSTIDYTYEPPGAGTQFPPGSFPTRAPGTTPPPGATQAPGTTAAVPTTPIAPLTEAVVTTAMIKELTDFQLGPITNFFEAPPAISFQNGLVRASLTVYTTPSDTSTARPVWIDMSLALEGERIRLTAENVVFADDNSPYEDTLAGYIQGVIETAINDQVNRLYVEHSPAGGAFAVTGVTVTDAGIVVQLSSG